MTLLLVVQIILAITMIGGILLQNSSAGLGGAFGGSDDEITASTRRGADKFVFVSTIVVAILFCLVSLTIVILS